MQATWAQTLTTLLLNLQAYPWIKSPLHFCGTSGLLPLINLFLSHLLTPITRTLPPSLLFHALFLSPVWAHNVASTFFWRDNQKLAGPWEGNTI